MTEDGNKDEKAIVSLAQQILEGVLLLQWMKMNSGKGWMSTDMHTRPEVGFSSKYSTQLLLFLDAPAQVQGTARVLQHRTTIKYPRYPSM